ncbi:hypothetical protein GCM10028777_02140 [Angustibacter speluncae]
MDWQMSTTTVKVQARTRDQRLEIAASRHLSADQVIVTALAALQRDERRQLAAAEARATAADPVDLAEMRSTDCPLAATSTNSKAGGTRLSSHPTGSHCARGSWRSRAPVLDRRASARRLEIGGQPTLGLYGQIATVDLSRLAEQAGYVTLDEVQRVDAALALVLDL